MNGLEYNVMIPAQERNPTGKFERLVCGILSRGLLLKKILFRGVGRGGGAFLEDGVVMEFQWHLMWQKGLSRPQ